MKLFHSFIFIISILSCNNGKDETKTTDYQEKWSVRMAESVMQRSDSLIRYLNPEVIKWQYDVAFLGQAIDRLGNIDPKYSKYMEEYMAWFVKEDATVKDYDPMEYNLDRINPAKNLITVYKRTGNPVYRKAINSFVEQMKTHPQTHAGGYWHKKIYPWQMWLDGIYMASPFLAQYASEFNEPVWFDTVTHQIKLIYIKTLDPSSGLLRHAWDESRSQRWCEPSTGQSKYPWSRAMGWYTMAITDVLNYLPEDHKDRDSLLLILNNTCEALLKVRDPKTGLWYQVLNEVGREGNYIEGSGSAMFAYVFARAANKGYLDKKYLDIANETFDSIVSKLITTDENGLLTMHNICGGCGLGGNPYRDGSYEYYITEKRIDNDPKGVAPFIIAAIELGR